MGMVRWQLPLLLGVAFVSRDALACGGGVVSKAADVSMDSQRVFVSYDSQKTDVVAQLGVPSAGSNFGALIPLHSEPTLDPDPVPVADLDELDRQTAPRVTVTSNDDSGHGCGCGSGDAGSKGTPSGVQVREPVNIGPVSATILHAEDANAVNAWLADNDFELPDGGADLVQLYCGSGRYFLALRRNDAGATTDRATSIGIHFSIEGDARALPLRFARLGATSAQAFTIFVVGDNFFKPAGAFAGLTLRDLEPDLIRARGYADAVQQAVASHGGKAFVIENTLPGSALTGISDALMVHIGDKRVTRLSTIISGKPTEDVQFNVPFDTAVSPDLQIGMNEAERTGKASLASLGFAALALLRRKRRAV